MGIAFVVVVGGGWLCSEMDVSCSHLRAIVGK